MNFSTTFTMWELQTSSMVKMKELRPPPVSTPVPADVPDKRVKAKSAFALE